MGIATGLLTSLNFGSDDVAADVMDLSLPSSNAQLDMSGLSETGVARISGRHDGSINLTVRISDAVTNAHDVFSPCTSSEVSASVVVTTVAGPVFTMHCTATSYEVSIGQDLKLSAKVVLMNDDGVAGVWS